VKKLMALLLLAACLACSGRGDLAGKYEALHEGPGGPVTADMVLAEDGSGKWEIAGEVLNFSWTAVPGGVRFHARDGAVVEGVLEGENVRLDVPGVGHLLFVRR
jgi:hypothetical protein